MNRRGQTVLAGRLVNTQVKYTESRVKEKETKFRDFDPPSESRIIIRKRTEAKEEINKADDDEVKR